MLFPENYFELKIINHIQVTMLTFFSSVVYYGTQYLQVKYLPNKIKLLKKYIQYGIPILLVSSFVQIYLFEYVSILSSLNFQDLRNSGILEVVRDDWFMYFAFTMMYMSIATLAAQLKYSQEKNKSTQKDLSTLKSLQTESELQILKNQINPHFLFNALSSIYSISYLKDERAPEKIMQLSKMLRYVLYDCNQNYVSLQKEIEYLESYIDFQKLKVSREMNVDFDYIINHQNNIAPMILQPLVENAFKHSAIQRVPSAYISIKIEADSQKIQLEITNSIAEYNKETLVQNVGGIGMENLTKRLKLLYPNQYNLEITEDSEVFKICLILKNKD
jgi:LytS/YehU family sensor histidine kinase